MTPLIICPHCHSPIDPHTLDYATGSESEIEEERRLLYVAMTRAKDHLALLIPQRFYVSSQSGMGDRHVYASRTRFITNRMLARFESQVWPQVEWQEWDR